jgi:lysophospholipase L1-like esterase
MINAAINRTTQPHILGRRHARSSTMILSRFALTRRTLAAIAMAGAPFACADDAQKSDAGSAVPRADASDDATLDEGGSAVESGGGSDARAAETATDTSTGTTRDASARSDAPEGSGSDVPEASGSDSAPSDARAGRDASSLESGPPTDPNHDAGDATGPAPDPATRMRCTGSDPIACHFGGAPGNYAVTVDLGGTVAGSTIIKAETERIMLGSIDTIAGATRRFAFGVNVRQPEGQPIQDVPAGVPGLDLYFAGSMGQPPQLQAIGYAPASMPTVIYLAGDSTVCDQTDTTQAGWGQMLPQYFKLPAVVANYADSGESSASFLASSSLFAAIESRLKSNDWVLIQFGHNDKTTSAAAFHDNMTKLVTRTKAKGAFPVLVTPVARAVFAGSALGPQHINETGADLPQIIKQVALEQNTPVLDLLARTTAWLNELGPDGWRAFHANGTDATHTNPAGAAAEAGFLRELIEQSSLTALHKLLR